MFDCYVSNAHFLCFVFNCFVSDVHLLSYVFNCYVSDARFLSFVIDCYVSNARFLCIGFYCYVSDSHSPLIVKFVMRAFIVLCLIVTLVMRALFVLRCNESSHSDDVATSFFSSHCYVTFLPYFFPLILCVLECLISVSISLLQFPFRKYLALIEARLIDKKDDASNSR